MHTLIVKTSFEAAHILPDHPGKCANLHGHSYRVDAEFAGTTLNVQGMLCDFAVLKNNLDEILPDHSYLNNELPFITTAENIARWIFEQLQERNLPVSAVTVWETEKYGCRYTAD